MYDEQTICALQFTGKERDTETGLDYFGARYYGSNMGRWMSPDWSDSPEPVPYADLTDPQTLNLYGYVRNNPLSRADVDGHDEGDPCGCTITTEQANHMVHDIQDFGSALWTVIKYDATTIQAGVATGLGMIGAALSTNTNGDMAGPSRIFDSYSKSQQARGAQPSQASPEGQSTPNDPNQKPYDKSAKNTERMQQGKPPIGKDGKPVELHSPDQTHTDESQEMTRTDHRGGDNFKKNHRNTGQEPSKVDRRQAARDRREHWKREGEKQ